MSEPVHDSRIQKHPLPLPASSLLLLLVCPPLPPAELPIDVGVFPAVVEVVHDGGFLGLIFLVRVRPGERGGGEGGGVREGVERGY